MDLKTENKRLIAIGEALIDFIPSETGKFIKEVGAFMPKVGGAPANVCGAFSRLGGTSAIITQLGKDPFGDKIVDEFTEYNINCDYIRRTDNANTSLAFVSLQKDGNREFSFYRKPGADMLYDKNYIQREWFDDCQIMHFCSVSLGDFPMRDAHRIAIEYAREAGAIISFDPNLRPALWNSKEDMIQAVKDYIPQADIVKISDEELEDICDSNVIETALDSLFTGNVKLVIYTEGAKGASAFTRRNRAYAEGIRVKAVDTTGAGDGFIGSFLYCLAKDGITVNDIEELTSDTLSTYLEYANRFSAKSVMKEGSLASYPTAAEI